MTMVLDSRRFGAVLAAAALVLGLGDLLRSAEPAESLAPAGPTSAEGAAGQTAAPSGTAAQGKIGRAHV